MPERLVSLSSCIAPQLPEAWAIDWTGERPAERERLAAAFGIGPEGLPELLRWVTVRFDSEIGWPDVCFGLDTARRLATFASGDDVLLVGIGVDERCVSDVLGSERAASAGMHGALIRRAPLAQGGESLGHDLVAANYGFSCSWLCSNGLEADVIAALGLRPNAHGLIDDPDAAAGAAEFLARPETGAEPGVWVPWLVVRYPP